MLSSKIIEVVRSVIGDASPEKPIALHEPLLRGNESKYVQDCITKNQVTQGGYIRRFEQMLCDFTGVEYAIATCNATCALEIAIHAAPYDEPDRIKIPALTFIATANAAIHDGQGIMFVDSDDATLPVHLLGHKSQPTGYVHDAAQALGTEGIYGDHLTIHSFNGNKIITTGGGGAIITNDSYYADYIRHAIAQCRVPHRWEINHDAIGYNYRMPNINAALGVAQMEQLPHILKAKRALAQKYIEAFSGIDGVKVWEEPAGTKSNYWLVAVLLDNPDEQGAALQALHDAGYLVRKLPTPLHLLKPYEYCPRGDVSQSEDLWKRTICLPSSPALGVRYA